MNLIGFYGIKRNESLVIFDASENYKAQILRLDLHFNGIHSDGKLGRYELNTFGPEQNGWHSADDISKCIILTETKYLLIYIWKDLPKGPNDNIPHWFS